MLSREQINTRDRIFNGSRHGPIGKCLTVMVEQASGGPRLSVMRAPCSFMNILPFFRGAHGSCRLSSRNEPPPIPPCCMTQLCLDRRCRSRFRIRIMPTRLPHGLPEQRRTSPCLPVSQQRHSLRLRRLVRRSEIRRAAHGPSAALPASFGLSSRNLTYHDWQISVPLSRNTTSRDLVSTGRGPEPLGPVLL